MPNTSNTAIPETMRTPNEHKLAKLLWILSLHIDLPFSIHITVEKVLLDGHSTPDELKVNLLRTTHVMGCRGQYKQMACANCFTHFCRICIKVLKVKLFCKSMHLLQHLSQGSFLCKPMHCCTPYGH